MSHPDPDTEHTGLLGHVRRAIEHAVQAARCYVALFVGDVEQRVEPALRRLVLLVGLMLVALIGVFLLLTGIAQALDAWLGPGWGRIVVGGAVLVLVAAVALGTRQRGRK